MRPFPVTLLLTTLVLFACHKKTPNKPANQPLSNVWRWTSYSLPGGGLRQPAPDSPVYLVLDRDSAALTYIYYSIASVAYYHINRDSSFMTFSGPLLLSRDSLKLCTSCALTVSGNTITLQAPTANPANYGVFTFVRPNPMPPCINCSQ